MKHCLRIFVTVVVCSIATVTSAQTNNPDEQARRLDSLYSGLHEANSFNRNVLIAEKGKVIFEKSYGIANEKTWAKLNAY